VELQPEMKARGSSPSALLHLHVHFETSRGTVRAVEGLSFEIAPGEVAAVAGESGSGKPVSALSIMWLLPRHTARMRGPIVFDGHNLLELATSSRSSRAATAATSRRRPSSRHQPGGVRVQPVRRFASRLPRPAFKV
jgi:ABC-type glutathione transport system ATPase component